MEKQSPNLKKILKRWDVITTILLLAIAIVINVIQFFSEIIPFEKILSISIWLILMSILVFILHEVIELHEMTESNEKIKLDLLIAYKKTGNDIKTALETYANKVERTISRTTSFKYVSEKENYPTAKQHLEIATDAKCTFFLKSLWSLQPGERGYDEQIKNLDMKYIQERENYFRYLNEKVNNCELKYDWLILVDTPEKFCALCDRIVTIISKSLTGLKEGYIEIHVLPMNQKTYFPLPCLQITRSGNTTNLIVSFLSTESRMGDSFTLTNISEEDTLMINMIEGWFNLLKKYSFTILSCNKINLKLLRHIGEEILNSDDVKRECERIKTLAIEKKIGLVR